MSDNKDLIGESWRDAKDRYEWTVTGVSPGAGYVDVTVKSLITAVTVETCFPANVVRARLAGDAGE